MRGNTLLNAYAGARPAILIRSVLLSAALGLLQALPGTAANADDTIGQAERKLAPSISSKPDEAVRVSETFGKLPLHFEANRGQTDPQVRFLSRTPKHTLFLASTEAVLVFTKLDHAGSGERQDPKARLEKPGKATQTVLRMTFLGANPDARVTGQAELPGKASYFIGSDPAQWRTNVPTYAKVQYEALYPGIDLIYYGNQRQLEYDFVVRPGADPSLIALGFRGADNLEVDAHGDLVLYTAFGALRQRKPVIYQEVAGRRVEIPGGYVLKDGRRVGFEVAAYDRGRPLVIDPVLFYSTYLGGSTEDLGLGITVDSAGNAYVTGGTTSTNFPTTTGAFQTAGSGGEHAFVTKLNPTGSGLVYSTYLGGSESELGVGIAVDTLGNAYVTGTTQSTNFPTTTGAFQTTFGGANDAFVTKLNPSGSSLVYSTYLGGSGLDPGFGIAVDTLGNAYVTGGTTSTNFPTTTGAFQTSHGGGFQDAFVTKLNPTGSSLVYSTYLGGSASDQGQGIAVDAMPSPNAYVTGITESTTNFPTTGGAIQPAFGGGGSDAFVTKLNPTGSSLVYSTYLGGSRGDDARGIAVDTLSNAYVTGITDSANFPTTLGAIQPAFGGGSDAFVTKLNPTGALLYSTYLGGSGGELGLGIAVDTLGNAYVTGSTQSINFPTTLGAFQTAAGGGDDAFVTKLNPSGSALLYSTYLGGSGSDSGRGIAVDAMPIPNTYVTGQTNSTNFPTTAGAFDTTFNGVNDAFVAKITDVVLPPPPTVGKVTGGGSINVGGGIGTFGFVVQRQAADQSIRGDLQYVNHSNGEKVHSVLITMFTVAGNTASFSGSCTNNGEPCTFIVNVKDNGEPGTNDSFTITIDAGPPEGANENLRSGNIQIHQ